MICERKAEKAQSQQSVSEHVEMNLNSLDSREQEVIMSLSGHCSFTESSSDASVTFNTSAILKEAWHHFH